MSAREASAAGQVARVAGRQIGGQAPAFLIAEVAQAHEGSLDMAHAFVDVVASAGADAIKFQTHIAAAESTRDEPFRVPFSRRQETRFDYWQRMEFSAEEWAGLAAHADERGLVFLSSPFSVEAVRLLAAIGMPAWKIGSGEVESDDVLDAIAEAPAPVLLSTGMSTWDEITRAVARVRQRGLSLCLLQCTSRYPTPLEEVGLNVLGEFARRFEVPVGLSDHSGTVWPSVAALARGASAIEVHVTLHPKAFGPDVPASLTPEQIAYIAEARNAFSRMDANPVDKDTVAHKLSQVRRTFGKSIAPRRALRKGEVLDATMLTSKKPATGISWRELGRVLGRRLARDVPEDRLLRLVDLEEDGID